MGFPEGLAGLPMYDLPELTGAHDALWTAIAARLGPGAPKMLDRVVAYNEQWRRDDLVLSQACGWPLVVDLWDAAAVVGTFRYTDVSDDLGRYRCPLVARSPDVDLTRAVAAVNSVDSLSGCISLVAALGQPFDIVVTGAHVNSLLAVRSGKADVACIDALTWSLLSRHRPTSLEGLCEIGRGPLALTLPLITRHPDHVATLRHVLADATVDPALVDALGALGIDSFIPLDREAYEPLRTMTALVTPSIRPT